jgi:ankyrin repeat protein
VNISRRNSANLASSLKDIQSGDGSDNEGEDTTNPFSSYRNSPATKDMRSPRSVDESRLAKIIIECDELFGVGIKRLIKIESSSDANDIEVEEFVHKLILCLKAYSFDSASFNESTHALYELLWESLATASSLADLIKFMTVSYYDPDVEDFVVLVDQETWKEFCTETKKRVKVILRTSMLQSFANATVSASNLSPTASNALSNESDTDLDAGEAHEEESSHVGELSVTNPAADDSNQGNWLHSHDDFIAPATFILDNDGDIVEILSESEEEDMMIERLNSNSYQYECPGTHWIKSPHHIPPLGAVVVAVNGVNISILDRDFQLALLKQRRRPLLISFQIPSEDKLIGIDPSTALSAESTPDRSPTWHQVSDAKQRVIIPFVTVQSKYAYSSMSKVRKTVDNILKEYINCNWIEAIKEKTGTPQATIISLYKYIESEMNKLGIIITMNDVTAATTSRSKAGKQQAIEIFDDDMKDQVTNHIESLIFQRIAEHTLQKVAIPYLAYQQSIEPASSSSITFESMSQKLSFLRFVQIHQLGLQGLPEAIREISCEQMLEREEWRLAMKGMCRALQFTTPSLILSKVVITVRLIIQALDALLNRYHDSNLSVECTLLGEEHHHVDNIMSAEEYDALKLLISSHQKYPSATSTDVLMLQKIPNPSSTAQTTSSTELSADEILPAIAWAVIQSNPTNIEAVLWMCTEFRHPQLLRGEEAYCLAQLTSAVEFVKRIDETMLDMSADDYQNEYHCYQRTLELFNHCISGSSVKVIAPLLDQGADVNGLTLDQCDTPLTLSIRHEHHHLISYFIKHPNIIVNKPISPCKGQHQNSTALLEAVRYNQIATVLKLLKIGGNRYHTDDNGYTALSMARENDYHDIVMVLQADPYRISYLDAIESEEVDLIRGLLLQGVDINMFHYDPSTAATAATSSSAHGRNIAVDLMLTPLMAATGCHNLYIIRTILDAESVDVGVVNQSDPYQDTALSYCLKRCCSLAPANFLVKLLRDEEDEEEDVEGREKPRYDDDDIDDVYGAQPYHVSIIAMLIQAGAAKDVSIIIDPTTGKTITPQQLLNQQLRMEASVTEQEDPPIAQVSSHTKPTDEPFNIPPTATAVPPIPAKAIPPVTAEPVLDIQVYYRAVETIDDLVDMKHPLRDISDLFLYDPSTHEIYNLAREKNYHGVISLLRQGADINQADPNKGYTPLIAATFNQDYLMIELILRSQSIIAESSPLPDQAPGNIYTTVREPLKPPIFLDINASGRGGMRALHYAAQIGDVKILGRLLEAQADRYLRNKKGLTAFDVALMNNHADAVNILRYDPTQISISMAARHGDWNVMKSLLNQGVSVNFTPQPNLSETPAPEIYCPLIAAVAHGHIDVAKNLLLIPSVDVNIVNFEGQTALMFAAARGDESMVLKLLHAGANRWLKDSKGKLAADWAAGQGHELVKVLLLHDPAEIYVHDVIRKGDFNATVGMFKQGIDVNLQRFFLRPADASLADANTQVNPLDEDEEDDSNPYKAPSASSSFRNSSPVKSQTLQDAKQELYQSRPRSPSPGKLLHEKQAPTNSRNMTTTATEEEPFIHGETPLCIACYYGRHDTVKILLKAPEIKVNLSDSQGWTPLHYAAYMNYEDIVIRLLKAKCNRRSFDLTGRTPVDVSIERGYHVIASLIEADPYIVHIHDMCEVGKILLVMALLKQGCPPTYRDERVGKHAQTPLMAASQGNQVEIVRMLLRYKEVIDDINAVDEHGMTALMKAAKMGALDITALLLNAGCDREMKDVKGLTARDYAANHSFSAMFQFMSQTMIR